MTAMIILTTDQADAVRGETSPGFALDPVPLVDGSWALPVRVLDDPAHEPVRDTLAGLPQREIEAEDVLHSDD